MPLDMYEPLVMCERSSRGPTSFEDPDIPTGAVVRLGPFYLVYLSIWGLVSPTSRPHQIGPSDARP